MAQMGSKVLVDTLEGWARQAAVLALGIKGLMKEAIPEGSSGWSQTEALAHLADTLFDEIDVARVDTEEMLRLNL